MIVTFYSCFFFFFMIRRPPGFTRTDTPFPYTTLFRSEDALLPHVSGLKGPFGCLNRARYGIGWGAMGAAEFCYEAARNYTLERQQFGRPLAANQIVRSEEHTSELQSLMRISYAVFCLKKKKKRLTSIVIQNEEHQ